MKKDKQPYEKPIVKGEKETQELAMACPTTSIKYCGIPFSPKKG